MSLTKRFLQPKDPRIPKWTFAIASILQAVVALALEGYVFAKFQTSLVDQGPDDKYVPATRAIPTYMSLLIFAFVFQLIVVYDALYNKNMIQVIGICIYNLGILVYTGIQIDQIRDAVKDLIEVELIHSDFWNMVRIPLFCVTGFMGLSFIVMVIAAVSLQNEFSWMLHLIVHADPIMRRRFFMYQIYIALLKFDFFFFLGFTVQFLVVVRNTSDTEFILTIIAIPVTILVLALAVYWVKKENMIGQVIVIFLWIASAAYFLFKLIRIYGKNYHRKEDYLPVRKSLTVFAVITLILLAATIIVSCICAHNFNKGLRVYISRARVRALGDGSDATPDGDEPKQRVPID